MEESIRAEDRLINRFFPEADEQRREEARAQLRRFVGAILEVAMRLAQEHSERLDSPELPGRLTIPPTPV